MTNTFSVLAEKQRQLEEELKAAGEGALKEYFTEIFENYPDLLAVRWAQYTPYFNDGDPCEFGVNEPYFKIVGMGEETWEYDDDEDEQLGYTSIYSLYEWVPDGPPEKRERRAWDYVNRVHRVEEYVHQPTKRGNFHPLYEVATKISSDLQANSRLLELAIGDHAEVTVTRDKITVEEYHHD